MRKFGTILLAAVCCIGCFAGCTPENDDPIDVNGMVDVWAAPSTAKYMQDGRKVGDFPSAEEELDSDFDYPEKSNHVLQFSGIKGEDVGYQLMLEAKTDIRHYNFEIDGDLVNSSTGDTISKDNLSVYAEHYFEVYQPRVFANYYPIVGYYPDALVPISRYIDRRQDKVEEGNVQGIWVNLDVPKDCAPGEYTGTGTLTVNGATRQIEIKADIVNVELPDEVHARSAFAVWYDMIGYGEGDSMTEETYRAYYEFMLDKRLTPTNLVPEAMTSIEAFVEEAERAAKDPRVTVYSAAQFVKPENTKADAVTLFTALAKRNIELRNSGDETTDLFKKLMIYKYDEPAVNNIPFETLENYDKAIYEAKKQVKTMLADYPDLQESLMKAEHLVTFSAEGISEELYATETEGGVQTWCPIITYFNAESSRQTALERLASNDREGGEDVWWYSCMDTMPSPSYHTDDIALSPRILSWMQFDYKVSGNLYWNVCNYRYYDGGQYVQRDIYNDPLTYTMINGEGQLIYPGSYYGLNTPVSSIRLENIRDGLEDYEYLLLAEQGIEALDGYEGKGREVLGKYFDSLYTGLVYNRDHAVFDVQLDSLLELLDALYNDTDTAKTIIDGLMQEE